VITTDIDNVKSGSATINVNDLVHLLLDNEDNTLLKVPFTTVANIEGGEVGPTMKDGSVLGSKCADSCKSPMACVAHYSYQAEGGKCCSPCAPKQTYRSIIVENLSVLALFQVRGVGGRGALRIDLETGIMEQ